MPSLVCGIFALTVPASGPRSLCHPTKPEVARDRTEIISCITCIRFGSWFAFNSSVNSSICAFISRSLSARRCWTASSSPREASRTTRVHCPINTNTYVYIGDYVWVTNRWGTAGLRSRRCQTVRRHHQKCLHRCRAGGRGYAEEKGRPPAGVPGRTRLTVTWRIWGGCLCLFDSNAIESRSNLKFLQ